MNVSEYLNISNLNWFSFNLSYVNFALFLVTSLAGFGLFKKRQSNKSCVLSRLPKPPGPKGVPFLGFYPFLEKEPHKQFFSLRSKYGNIFSLYLGSKYVVILNNFETVKEAFGQKAFLGRPPSSPFLLVKDGISFIDSTGPLWQTNRRFTLRVLRDLGFGKTHMETRLKWEVEELSKEITTYKGSACPFRTLVTSSVSNNVTFLAFGRRYPYDHTMRKFLDEVVNRTVVLFKQTGVHIYMPWLKPILYFFGVWNYGKAKVAIKKFFKFVQSEIISHEKTILDGSNRDYIDGYLHEIQKCKEPGLNKLRLKGNVRSILTAGTEPVRTTLDLSLRTMAAYQSIQRRVQEELDTVLGPNRLPCMSDQPNTPFTQATIWEVMRFHGIAPLGILRQTVEDSTVSNYFIPKGTIAIANLYSLHHDPDVWDEPFSFKPERFLSQDGKRASKPEYFCPFSYGSRSCPGEVLAYVELYIYFATLVKNFTITPPKGVLNIVENLHEICLTPRNF